MNAIEQPSARLFIHHFIIEDYQPQVGLRQDLTPARGIVAMIDLPWRRSARTGKIAKLGIR